jgi:hypothetical protein
MPEPSPERACPVLGWPNQRGPDPVAGSGPRFARALRVTQALEAES